jgi:branched-chain amino acid transport system ATP-binding protein
LNLRQAAAQRTDKLPFGQQRLLEVARELALRSRLLLLDERAAGLNNRETQVLTEFIKSLPSMGITVLLV